MTGTGHSVTCKTFLRLTEVHVERCKNIGGAGNRTLDCLYAKEELYTTKADPQRES